ncbi:reactive mitochondrial oxygen species modulator 1-domain-containing protein [Halteromyces radiatus]|uniref:reactive mitochondrial oxygen species modulator 1-domain-containing protein n=1 Tax=Halteromyces radiatus TaxID=101107 RepID=UPI00221FFA58|nr:reactive mitochondrial oxygen species modulator 1-domain-containing protein [Halteromyces radiatus]KAI8092599.1 reactive mitochondrial oxygen species modulator 1-domain-containing protein [Halteromyces radiatus]
MEPSTLDKMKMGALMGGTVGLCVGFVFGGITILRFGGGRKGALSTLSQYMLGSAASFGFFMSIGSVIRSEGAKKAINWQQSHRLPVIINQPQEAKHLD